MAIDVDADGEDRGGPSTGGAGEEREQGLEGERLSTIYAPSTAHGRAAVAILRVSGPGVGNVFRHITGAPSPRPRMATVHGIRNPDNGNRLDTALFLFFPAPASFTGEDLLEIQHHGGLGVCRAIDDILARSGFCRLADPGEFTRRAFLNGKMDLTQAEAVADLAEAATVAQVEQSSSQLAGSLSGRFQAWRLELIRILSIVEAEIDFGSDDDLPDQLWRTILPDLERLRDQLCDLLADDHSGERLRRGIVIAVAGRTNVGKSTLVNLLARREVAITSAIPGTTRDVLEVALDIRGIPVTLLDTAGLRETADPVEAEGVRRAVERAAGADLRMLVDDDPHFLEQIGEKSIPVLSKCDAGAPAFFSGLAISCRSGYGIEELLERLFRECRDLVPKSGVAVLSRTRHRQCVQETLDCIDRALDRANGPLDIFAEEVRCAGRSMGRLTGHVHTEDVLDAIFWSFCIGK